MRTHYPLYVTGEYPAAMQDDSLPDSGVTSSTNNDGSTSNNSSKASKNLSFALSMSFCVALLTALSPNLLWWSPTYTISPENSASRSHAQCWCRQILLLMTPYFFFVSFCLVAVSSLFSQVR